MNDEPKKFPHILDAILSRPGMYWGNSSNHFHSFMAFLSGCELALSDNMNEELKKQMKEIIPHDFHKFVTEYFGYTYPHGGCGWQTFIEMNTNSDQEALALFQKLRDACLKEIKEA